jgi:hypothetical protein
LTVTFERIWSDQFGAVEINYLPGGSGGVTNYVFMGARGNNMAQGATRLSFSPPDPSLRTNLYVRFCLLPPVIGGNPQHEIPAPNGGVPIGEGTLFSDVALVRYDTSLYPPTYSNTGAAICVGFDTNGNYSLDPDEITQISPYRFRIIDNSQYETARLECTGGSWLFYWPFPFDFHWASEFMSYFVGGSPPVGSTESNTTIHADDPRLSHRVGAVFNADGLAQGKEILFGPTSALAETVLDDPILLDNIVWNTLVQMRPTVQNYYSIPPGNQDPNPTHVFDPFPLAVNSLSFESYDLFLSFGVCLIQGNIIVTVRKSDKAMIGCRIQADITDMYDWNMEGFDIDKIPGTVQAGYNTLGNAAGHIYVERVHLDNEVENISFTFQ